MKVYIVGEDAVSYAIIERVLLYCSPKIKIISKLPARGGQIKSKIPEFNKLALSSPVILLTDLDDGGCAPQLLKRLLPSNKNDHFIFNIAIDEAEAWLMADREGFSRYFSLDLDDMPIPAETKQGGRIPHIEMDFRYKSSRFLTHELMPKSKNKNIQKQLIPKPGAAKGAEYNTAMLPFIENYWDISRARINTNSLDRMIRRIENLLNDELKKIRI